MGDISRLPEDGRGLGEPRGGLVELATGVCRVLVPLELLSGPPRGTKSIFYFIRGLKGPSCERGDLDT